MEDPTVTSLQSQETREPKPPNPEGAEPVAVTASVPDSKKRKHVGFRDSEYVKVRALVKELRPFFMEVLHAPDFKNSKAAYEIQKRMKTMLELTKQLNETTSTLKPNKVHEQPLHGAVLEQNEDKKMEVEKQTTQPQPQPPPQSQPQPQPQPQPHPQPSETVSASGNSEMVTKQKVESKVMEKLRTEVSRGTFVVGGSPVGWNFLLYPGTKLAYYGRTKESVLASRASK